MKVNINSRRAFNILYSEGIDSGLMKEMELNSILDNCNDLEIFYALQDQIDKILDLSVGHSLVFQPNRDQGYTKGIITRIR